MNGVSFNMVGGTISHTSNIHDCLLVNTFLLQKKVTLF